MASKAYSHQTAQVPSAIGQENRSCPVKDPSTVFAPNTADTNVISDLIDATDEHLIALTREGNRDALGRLFRRHAGTCRTVIFRILRSEPEADDLVQDLFLFVFRKAALFNPARCSGRSWLIQIAYHRAFDRRRYLISRGFYSNCEIDESHVLSRGAKACTYESLECTLGERMLRRVEGCLSEVQKRVLQLRIFEGHTIEEIAAMLGQSPGNVRNHYYRALEKMRREILPLSCEEIEQQKPERKADSRSAD